MGKKFGPKKGGKSRYTQGDSKYPRAEEISTSVVYVDSREAEDEGSQNEEDFIPLTSTSNSNKQSLRQNNGNESSSLEDSDGALDYIQNILNDVQSEDDNQIESDEEFAKLVEEYRHLMYPVGSTKDLEWSLDEDAARILRDRRANDPKYSNMTTEEFDEIICFDEVYGKKIGRNLQARLHRKKSQHPKGPNSERQSSRHTRDLEEISFKQINREVKEFVRNEEGEELKIEPYPPMIRKLIHELAHFYGLNSRSDGQGVDRHCVLIKCESTRLPRDLKRLDKFILNAQKAVRYSNSNSSSSKSAQLKKNNSSTVKARVPPGSVVGGEASPIDEENIGNRMLRKLGWTPGEGLGEGKGGIKDPIEAIFRGNRAGLG